MIHDPAEAQPIPPSVDLTVDQLSFRYPQEQRWALDNISFSFEEGKSLLITGPSGAGKSTLLEVLLRLWPITSGTITSADIDIKHFDPQAWRQAWASLPQPARLLGDTIRQNLRLTRPEASEAEMLTALQDAQAEDLLSSLPKGLDTWIGEAGLQLSGGERQRLALARALIGTEQPMLLDEPAAHLDPHTARRAMRAILKHVRGRGAIIVSHWLAGLETVDEILVLQDGKITERGSHKVLIDHNKWYALQWRLQNSEAHLAAMV
jgi:ABC-type multidrug transport system fused ATPase/permease subunit